MKNIQFKLVKPNLIVIGVIFLLSGCASLFSEHPAKKPFDINAFSSPDTLFAAEILRVDVDQLITSLEEIHPEPYALTSKQDFLQKARAIKQSIRYPLSRSEFYLRVAPLVAELGDIHTRLGFPKYLQNKTLQNQNSHNKKTINPKQKNKLFPLAVLYEKEGLYVAADLSSTPQIPTGAIIKEINSAPVDFLLQVMKRLIAKETGAGQRRRIQVDFPWLLAVMGYAKPDYDISYRWQEQNVTVNVKGIDPPAEVAEQTKSDNSDSLKDEENPLIGESKSSTSFYGFSKLTAQTALLWFNDFNEDPQIFEAFLDNQFEQLATQGLTNLIIDVRYNDGGLSQNIKNLLSHITKKPVYWAKSGEINISAPLKKLHQEKTRQRRINKYAWGLQWLPLEWTDSLQYEISWSDSGEKITVDFEAVQPADSAKPIKVIVLTNGFCYSACSSFVATVNQYQLANTIGEIAGSIARVQYGYPLTTKLPHSQLKFVLPTIKLLLDPEIDDRRAIMLESDSLIAPGRAYARTQQQIINRQDTILNVALRQLQSGN